MKKQFGYVIVIALMLMMTITGCDTPTSFCGDGICSIEEKAMDNCPQDCAVPSCSMDADCGPVAECGNTRRCNDGTCEQIIVECPACTDTDGGLNYYAKGNVIDDDQDVTDWCDSNTMLVENYCNGEVLGNEYYKCSDTCSDGACVDSTCKLTDFLKNGQTQTYTIDGKDYEITVDSISDEAVLIVNGMKMRSLAEGEKYMLSGYFGIKLLSIVQEQEDKALAFCVLKEPSDEYIIKQNFRELLFTGSQSDLQESCVIVDDRDGCDNHQGSYGMYFEGNHRTVNVMVEVYSEPFTFEKLRNELWLNYVDDGGAVSLKEYEAIKDGGDTKYYVFEIPYASEMGDGEDVIAYWTSGNKIISLTAYNYTDENPFGQYVGNLFDAYWEKYPSDLQFEPVNPVVISKCVLSAGFGCIEYSFGSCLDKMVQMRLQNNLGIALNNLQITLEDEEGNVCTSSDSSNILGAVANGDIKTITFDGGCVLKSDQNFNGKLGLSYVRNGETIVHIASGTITAPHGCLV